MAWIYLFGAIGFEIIATSLMKHSNGFTKVLPTIGTFVGYIVCFTLLSFALKKIDLGVAYAIWSAVGIIVLTTIGVFFFKEEINFYKVISLCFIIVGVIDLNLSAGGR